VGGRRRAAVDGDLKPPGAGFEKQLYRAPALGDGQEDPLAGRAERENPVDASLHKEADVGRERLLVERCAAVAERRQRGGESTVNEHDRQRVCAAAFAPSATVATFGE